jgi:hypothetical protein
MEGVWKPEIAGFFSRFLHSLCARLWSLDSMRGSKSSREAVMCDYSPSHTTEAALCFRLLAETECPWLAKALTDEPHPER